jgi:hypothetical protein
VAELAGFIGEKDHELIGRKLEIEQADRTTLVMDLRKGPMAGVMGTRSGTAARALAAVPETESGSVSSGVTCKSVRVARSSSTA